MSFIFFELFFFFSNSVTCRKLIRQIILAHRNANFVWWEVIKSSSHLPVLSYLHLSVNSCQHSWWACIYIYIYICFFILLWTGCNIFLVISLITELSKIFDKCSFYICRVMILLFKNSPLTAVVWLHTIAKVIRL